MTKVLQKTVLLVGLLAFSRTHYCFSQNLTKQKINKLPVRELQEDTSKLYRNDWVLGKFDTASGHQEVLINGKSVWFDKLYILDGLPYKPDFSYLPSCKNNWLKNIFWNIRRKSKRL